MINLPVNVYYRQQADVRRRVIRSHMYARMMTTRELAKAAQMSVSHCYNLIAGVEISRPGRSRIEAVLGVKIWPKPGEGEPISECSGVTDEGGGGESGLQHPSNTPPGESHE